MLYLVCPVVLLLVCLGSSLVDAFLSSSRLVIQNSNTVVASGSALSRVTIGHCKSCPCVSCLRHTIGGGSSISLKASSVGITTSRRISVNSGICSGRSSCTCASCGSCSGKNSCSCASCARSGVRWNRNSKVVTCSVCNFAPCGCGNTNHKR